jgi:hypothetical protein
MEINDEEVWSFAYENGGMEVHRSWRDTMLTQDREVSEKRMDWDMLDERDRELGRLIAYDVILDFPVWYNGHHSEFIEEIPGREESVDPTFPQRARQFLIDNEATTLSGFIRLWLRVSQEYRDLLKENK